MSMREIIVEFMKQPKYKPMLKEELAISFKIDRKEQNDFFKVLESMEKEAWMVRSYNVTPTGI